MPKAAVSPHARFTGPAGTTRYVLRGMTFSDTAEKDQNRIMARNYCAAARARPAKRCLDIAGALAGLFLFGPLMIVVYLLIKREGSDAFFAHERIGVDGVSFRCLKFRTMAPDAKERLAAILSSDPVAREEWEREHKLTNDPRITPLGAFLRKTSLDELPQFLNVLRGEMSLVGPRPITADEIVKYGDGFSYYAKCRPGITGLWQVSGRNDVSYPRRVALDTQYALNQTVWLDCTIMLRTFGAVTSGSGAR